MKCMCCNGVGYIYLDVYNPDAKCRYCNGTGKISIIKYFKWINSQDKYFGKSKYF